MADITLHKLKLLFPVVCEVGLLRYCIEKY